MSKLKENWTADSVSVYLENTLDSWEELQVTYNAIKNHIEEIKNNGWEVTVITSSHDIWEQISGYMTINFTRPMTEAEIVRRDENLRDAQLRAEANAAEREAADLREYKRLLKKYGRKE